MTSDSNKKRHWTQSISLTMKPRGEGSYVPRNLFIGVAVGVLLLNLTISIWGHNAVEGTLRYIVNYLSSDMLKIQTSVVQQWYRGESEMVKSWAGSTSIEKSTLSLHNQIKTGTPDTTLMSTKSYKSLEASLNDLINEVGYVDFLIARRDGTILVAKESAKVGSHVSPLAVSWIAMSADAETVPPTVIFKNEIYKQTPDVKEMPIIPIVIPIKVKGEYVATLFALIDPNQEFNQLFNIMGSDPNIDIFAFNRQGLLITNSRRVDTLKDKGLLLDNDIPNTILNAQMRVPSTDINDTGGTSQQLTYAASKAFNENQPKGINLEGYPDFTGNEVVGAWLWFDNANFGVAIELNERSADRLMRPLRITQHVIFFFLWATLFAILGITYFNFKLRAKVDQIEELGQYKLIDKIGEGGMGEVFYAKHAMLLRPTAIKLLKTDADDEVIQRFEKEVRLTSQLTHPNTIEVYDYGLTQSGRFYYAMEYIEGFNLAELIELSPAIPASRVIHLLKQVCGSLKEAHNNGIVHRDIKPMNIMVTQRAGAYDQVKVLDFGLVKMFEEEESDLTSTQVLRGTPSYIAPERLVNARCAEPSVDIYAVAAIGYNLITGKDLYTGTTQMEVMSKAMSEMPARIKGTTEHPIPEALIDLLMRNLNKKPEERQASMEAFYDALDIIDRDSAIHWEQKEAKAWWVGMSEKLPHRDLNEQNHQGKGKL